jgi:hypothetical protein
LLCPMKIFALIKMVRREYISSNCQRLEHIQASIAHKIHTYNPTNPLCRAHQKNQRYTSYGNRLPNLSICINYRSTSWLQLHRELAALSAGRLVWATYSTPTPGRAPSRRARRRLQLCGRFTRRRLTCLPL